MAAVSSIRISTIPVRASAAGVTLLAYEANGVPVGVSPVAVRPTPADIGAASADATTAALVLKQDTAQKGLANGYAPLDLAGRVPVANLPASATGIVGLSDVAPLTLAAVASTGTALTAARSDHRHAMPSAGDVGAAAVVHVHPISGVTSLQAALDARILAASRGLPNGVAPLDVDGKVPNANLPTVVISGLSDSAPEPLGLQASAGTATASARADHIHLRPTPAAIGAAPLVHTHAVVDVVGLQVALDAKQALSARGAVNGYAPLGADSKVPVANLPASSLAGLSDTAPAPLAAAAAPGVATVASRSDHVHIRPSLADLGAAAATHVHTIANVTGLQGAIDARQVLSERGAALGYAPLDAAGKVPAANLPPPGGVTLSDVVPAALGTVGAAGTSPNVSRADHAHVRPTPAEIGAAPTVHTHTIASTTGLQAALDAKEALSAKGVANGYAPLGADLKVPLANLPPGVTQAALDAKADAAATTASLNLKADLTDTRIVNAVQPGYLTVISDFAVALSPVQADANKVRRCTSATDVVVTLPALSIGTTIRFLQYGAGKMVFAAGTNQVIGSFNGLLSSAGQHANVVATVVQSNTWNLSGTLI